MMRRLVEYVLDGVWAVTRGPIVVDHSWACPDLIEAPAVLPVSDEYPELDRTWQAIVTTRVEMNADLRYVTGLADEDLDEWQKECGWVS